MVQSALMGPFHMRIFIMTLLGFVSMLSVYSVLAFGVTRWIVVNMLAFIAEICDRMKAERVKEYIKESAYFR